MRGRGALAVAVAALAAAPAAHAATFTPVADSYVASDQPSANYGTNVKLRSDGSPAVRSYLRFTVTGTSGAVTKATLTIFNNTGLGAGYSLYGVANTTWGERTITWSNAPPPAVGATATSGGVAAGTTTSLDVTRLVTGNGTFSFALASSSATAISWQSREATANRPQLVVETGGSTPPPPSGGDPVIAAAGDIACDPASSTFNGGLGGARSCRQKYTSDLLLGGGIGKVLTLGDNQYETGTLSAFQQSYDPSWGRVKSITSPVPGNHEYGASSTAAGYFDYFGTRAGDRGKGYYSFDVGSWHVIALNSNCSRVACAPGSVQEQWLRSDLAAHRNACTLAYWHHPLFSSGGHGNVPEVKPFWDALYAAGADVVLNGHDHLYERFAPQTPGGTADSARGLREFIVGTGGKNQTAVVTVKPNSQVRGSGTFGVLRLTLHPSGYDWRFQPEAGKTWSDAGSGACH